MARYRSRSRSYSPRRRSRTPPRGRKRYNDEPRERHRVSRSDRDRRSPGPTGLLIRNLPLDAREPRGFGFVKYRFTEDAAEAKQQLNHTVIGGREIRIVYAEENRKTPREMRTSTHTSRYGGSSRRRTPPRSPRHGHHSYSPSPSPLRRDSRTKDAHRSPVRSRSASRSPPRKGRDHEKRQSPKDNGHGPSDERGFAPSRSRSPRGTSHSPSRSRSLSYSPR